jgi:hypothetical protein
MDSERQNESLVGSLGCFSWLIVHGGQFRHHFALFLFLSSWNYTGVGVLGGADLFLSILCCHILYFYHMQQCLGNSISSPHMPYRF